MSAHFHRLALLAAAVPAATGAILSTDPFAPPSTAAATAPAAPLVASPYPGGALDTDCSHVADGLGGPGYQFIATCRGRGLSPDGRCAVVQRGARRPVEEDDG